MNPAGGAPKASCLLFLEYVSNVPTNICDAATAEADRLPAIAEEEAGMARQRTSQATLPVAGSDAAKAPEAPSATESAAQPPVVDGSLPSPASPPPSDGGAAAKPGAETVPLKEAAPVVPAAGAAPVAPTVIPPQPVVPQSSLSVRAWGEKPDGTVIGIVAEWNAEDSKDGVSWYSAQPLNFTVESHRDARLKIELWERKMTLLGSLEIPLTNVPQHVIVSRALVLNGSVVGGAARSSVSPPPEGKEALMKVAPARVGMSTRQTRSRTIKANRLPELPCSIKCHLIKSRQMLMKRTCYFIRHAESRWNKAARDSNLLAMANNAMGPGLSKQGILQAEALGRRVQLAFADVEDGNQSISPLLRLDRVYVAPYMEVVQTAVVALGELLCRPGRPASMTLMVNADPDPTGSMGNFKGCDSDALRRRLREEMKRLYGQHWEERAKATFRCLELLEIDTHEVAVQQQLATGGSANRRKKTGVMDCRADEFMNQLIFSPYQVMIVVGQSQFFRRVFRRFISDDFRQQRPQFAHRLAEMRLNHCGVVRVDLDPEQLGHGGPITNAELVLDSELTTRAPPWRGFCCCRRAAADDDVPAME